MRKFEASLKRAIKNKIVFKNSAAVAQTIVDGTKFIDKGNSVVGIYPASFNL